MNQTAFAATLLEPERPCPPGLRTWNGSDVGARLAVHRNNVVGSLIDAVADTFPVVQQLVGEAFFRAMASLFGRAQPPRSRVLAQYGAGFPAFVERFEPARQLTYLADVARLEWARVLAYHAADAAPLAVADIGAALSGDGDASELRLVCHPSLSIVEARSAIVSIWAVHQGEDASTALAAVDTDAPESALVVRQGVEVLVLPLLPGAPRFITALQSGTLLAAAGAQGFDASAEFDLALALRMLAQHDALTAIRATTEPAP